MTLMIVSKKASSQALKEMAEHFQGYVKVVVDIRQKLIAAGADRHFEEEQALLANGSQQADLWGGGIDLETKEIDYNSVINLRPNQDNPSRDILSKEVRALFDKIINDLLF